MACYSKQEAASGSVPFEVQLNDILTDNIQSLELSLKFADKIVIIDKKSETISGTNFSYGRIDSSTVFIRDESNKVIGWSDGTDTVKKIDVND